MLVCVWPRTLKSSAASPPGARASLPALSAERREEEEATKLKLELRVRMEACSASFGGQRCPRSRREGRAWLRTETVCVQGVVMSDWIKRFLPFASLVALCVLIAAAEPKFLSTGNLAGVARQTAVITIMAMGMTVVMVSGGIDLSVGSMMALASVVGAFAMTAGAPVLAGIAASVAAGAACGLLNGGTVAALRIPPFIVTLGAMGVYRGVALLVTDGKAVVGLPQGFGYLAEGSVLGIVPVPLLLVVVVALATHFLLAATRPGRYCYAVGSNVEAARFAGVRVSRYQVMFYVILGALTGLAGAIESARLVT